MHSLFSLYGETMPFCDTIKLHVLVKTRLPFDGMAKLCYEQIVWRQLEFAFFGAATPVAALFICTVNEMKGVLKMKVAVVQEYRADILVAVLHEYRAEHDVKKLE